MTPALSIVVPTHDRVDHLESLVRALAALRPPPGGLEVVLVDDASADATPHRLAALVEAHRIAARILRTERNLGPAGARNAGWRAATAAAVAFLDDDCRPDPGWATAMAAALTRADVVQGRTVPDPDQRRGPFSHTLRIEHLTRRYETCNIGYRRSVLTALDGFDERFSLPYGEDIDLGWRAVEMGATVAFEPIAIARHDVARSSVRVSLHRAGRVGAMATVVRRHPGYRQELHWGVFTDRSHLWALVAAAATISAVARRRPALAVPAAGYLVHRLRTAPLWQRWKSPVAVPLALVVDLREVASLARASLRERTLVL